MAKDEDDNLGSFYMGRMRKPPEPQRILPRGLLSVITILAFIGIVWYAYPENEEQMEDIDVPVIRADTTPWKTLPEDPGGMDVPHQDSTIFDAFDKSSGERVENLLSKDEKPMDKAKLSLEGPGKLNLEKQMKEEPVEKPAEDSKEAPKKEEAKEVKKELIQEKKKEEVKKESLPPTLEVKKPTVKGSTYIQLGSYRKSTGAGTDWKSLQKKYPDLLKDLSMRTQKVDLGAKGVFHRLQAGPMSLDQAKKICTSLKAKNTGGCLIVK